MARGGDAVLEIDDAPFTREQLAIGTAEACRPAVVDVDDSPAAARQELNREGERQLRLRGRAAVDERPERRQLVRRPFEVGVRRRVVERVRGAAARRGELDRTADGDRLRSELEVGRSHDLFVRPVGDIDDDDRRRLGW